MPKISKVIFDILGAFRWKRRIEVKKNQVNALVAVILLATQEWFKSWRASKSCIMSGILRESNFGFG